MSEMLKSIFIKFVLPLLAPVLVGLGSSLMGTLVLNAELQGRVSHIEDQVLKHEKMIEKEFSRHEQKTLNILEQTNDQEKRLTRLEVLFMENQKTLAEIRDDLKILLRTRK